MKTLLTDRKLIFILQEDLYSHCVAALTEEATINLQKNTEYDEIELDMSASSFVDSKGITFIVGLYKSAVGRGKSFQVSGVSAEIAQLFQLMRLDEVFPVKQL